MAEGESRSDDKREDDEMHGRMTHEPWLIKFLRKARAPFVYGRPVNPISEKELRENEELEETPEEEMRELEEEKHGTHSIS